MAGQPPDPAQPMQVKVRHGPVLYDCTISIEERRSSAADGGDGSEDSSGELSHGSGLERNRSDLSTGHDDRQRSNVVRWHTPSVAEAQRSGTDNGGTQLVQHSGDTDDTAASLVNNAPEWFTASSILDGQRTAVHPSERGTAVVKLACQDQGLAPGQFAVFYQQGVCVGSGVITEAV